VKRLAIGPVPGQGVSKKAGPRIPRRPATRTLCPVCAFASQPAAPTSRPYFPSAPDVKEDRTAPFFGIHSRDGRSLDIFATQFAFIPSKSPWQTDPALHWYAVAPYSARPPSRQGCVTSLAVSASACLARRAAITCSARGRDAVFRSTSDAESCPTGCN
jgi:hypothetical protein